MRKIRHTPYGQQQPVRRAKNHLQQMQKRSEESGSTGGTWAAGAGHPDSEIYREYRRQSERVDNAGNMREKIDEYRIRNFELQNSAYTEDLLDKMEAFEREYEKFREDPLVEEFLDAELAFCRMMQEIDVKLAAAVDFV